MGRTVVDGLSGWLMSMHLEFEFETPAREITDAQFDSLYHAMKCRAREQLRGEIRSLPLQTTALVHEAYMRLPETPQTWESKQHFLNTVSTIMRRVLVDHARARRAEKRGGGLRACSLSETTLWEDSRIEFAVELHDALEHYAVHQPEKAKLVELRVFAGMSLEAAAGALGVSAATAKRYWAIAKLQLAQLLED